MLYLVTQGLPPTFQAFIEAWTVQVKMLGLISWYRYQIAMEYKRHLELKPSEQYRRHLRAGGWGAY